MKNGGGPKKAPNALGIHRYVGGDPPSVEERLEMLEQDLTDLIESSDLRRAGKQELVDARSGVRNVLGWRREGRA